MARRHRKKRNKDQLGKVIIAMSALGLAILITIPLLIKLTEVPYDDETFCPLDRPYPHTVIMIDKTDPLTETQEEALRNIIARIKSDMTLYEKLSIFVLDDQNYTYPQPRFALCNPGSGDDASPIYQNPKLMQIRFEEVFGNKIDTALDDIQLGDTRPNSPIMEMIRTLQNLPDFISANKPRRLIIFSDMLQHMPGYSHYRASPNFETFKETEFAKFQRADLAGVNVSIMYLVRDKTTKRQTNRHGLFWEQYFDWMGAQLQEIRPIR